MHIRTFLSSVVLLGAAVGCARTPNVTTNQLPLKRVVIYRNGVGYFERQGHIDANSVKFKMRGSMVGDFLATLAIMERGGSSVRSASFPMEVDGKKVAPEAPHEFASLLKPWPGKQPKPEPEDDDPLKEVVLRLDGGEHDLAVGYVAETPVWRPSYRVVIRDGKAQLQAWGIVQNLSGEDWENVKMVLVAGAPLAFESTLGDPVIPERPIVTDTGEVIARVPEGVTSLKNADAEKADKEAPAPPPEPGEYGGAKDGIDGDIDTEEEAGDEPTSGFARPSAKSAGAAYRPKKEKKKQLSRTEARRRAIEEARRGGLSRPRSVNALAGVAVEAGSTRYSIPSVVTVPDESATMVLLLSKSVPGEAVFLFSPDGGVPDSAAHPFRVARFTNATKGLLERGPIAVFEKGSFLGQGMLDPLPPKATATVPFALERGLAVQSRRESDTTGSRLAKIEFGNLYVERDSVTKTIYTVKSGVKDSAKVLVKHRRQPDARLHEPPAGTEDNVGTGAALVPIVVSGYAKSELVVDERRSYNQSVDWLSPLADEAVSAFVGASGSSATVVAKLSAAWKLRGRWKRASDEYSKLNSEQRELQRAAREWRLSLKAIEKNTQAADLRRDLERRLRDNTSRQEKVSKRLIQVQMEMNEARIRFRDAARGIKYRRPADSKP